MFRINLTRDILVVLTCLLSVIFCLPSFIGSKSFLPNNKINLGLDLQGGAYLLLDVDFDSYFKEQIQKSVEQITSELRKSSLSVVSITKQTDSIKIIARDKADITKIKEQIFKIYGQKFTLDADNLEVLATISDYEVIRSRNEIMGQTIEIVRRRIDEAGNKEIDLQRQEDNYILVQVPGLQDPNEIKRLLGKTAKLTFHLVNDSLSNEDMAQGKIPFGSKILPLEDKDSGHSTFIPIQSRAMLSGDMVDDAHVSLKDGNPVVSFHFNPLGAKIFAEITSKYTGKPFAIVLDNKIISAPRINEPILGGRGDISGNFSVQSATELALLLRAGALPAQLKVAEERAVGPSLGLDSVQSGTKAAVFGAALVVMFMITFYGIFGMIANIALLFNFTLLISILAIFGSTLTMPGIAGIVLTLGMAVDANVLIFERIKEEMRKGRTALASIESGYNMAFSTIIDSNITTILAALILVMFGSGPVKGFAISLTVGILCSMFTAITVTKMILVYWYRRSKPKHLPL